MKLIGYLNECDEPVIKEMTDRDVEYCECGGLQLLYACDVKDMKFYREDVTLAGYPPPAEEPRP